ncbi:MAG TPA: type II CAAX endopeptidase family protein [Candidatus Limnocylindrales bacterium]
MTESGPPEESSDPSATPGPDASGRPEPPDLDPGQVSSHALTSEAPAVEVPPPADPAPDGAVASARPGLRTFSLEHRVAPGLYLVGWLACLVGLGLVLVGLLSGPSVGRVVLLIVGLASLSVGLMAGAGQQSLERRARGQAGYAGPSPFLVFAAAVPISVLLDVLAAFILTVFGLDFDSPAGIVAGSLATALPFVGLVRLLVIGTGALTVRDLGFVQRGAEIVRGIGAGALWGVALVFATGLLALALGSLLPVPSGPLPVATSAVERLADVLVAVVIAPLSEEIFFRGFATTAWARTMSRGGAIVRSGLFFAFIHVLTVSGADSFGQGLGFAAFAFLGRIPVSLALAAVFLRRGSIYESLALHSTFNALPLLIVFLA